MSIEDDFATLRQALVQHQRSMGELGWTMANVSTLDALSRVEAEIARLAERNKVQAEQLAGVIGVCQDAIAENDRLRDGLREIEAASNAHPSGLYVERDMARALLGEDDA